MTGPLVTGYKIACDEYFTLHFCATLMDVQLQAFKLTQGDGAKELATKCVQHVYVQILIGARLLGGKLFISACIINLLLNIAQGPSSSCEFLSKQLGRKNTAKEVF